MEYMQLYAEVKEPLMTKLVILQEEDQLSRTDAFHLQTGWSGQAFLTKKLVSSQGLEVKAEQNACVEYRKITPDPDLLRDLHIDTCLAA